MDRQGTGSISLDDICHLCRSQGVQIDGDETEVVRKYFRLQVESLTFDQFCSVLKSKNLSFYKPI